MKVSRMVVSQPPSTSRSICSSIWLWAAIFRDGNNANIPVKWSLTTCVSIAAPMTTTVAGL
ncbi:MAG: hypothetical protein CM15mP74_08320 [Halieaceae bacterium]|nr:MAG: hypothetical protein CM15mP74_08320 [Halieaceae bacterium]